MNFVIHSILTYTSLEFLTKLENIKNIFLLKVIHKRFKHIDYFNLKENIVENCHKNAITSLLMISKDEFCSGSVDKTIIIWKRLNSKFEQFQILIKHKDGISDMLLFKSKYLCSSSWDKSIIIWKINDKKEFDYLTTLENCHSSAIKKLSLFDENLLISGSKDKYIIIWQWIDKKESFINIKSIKLGDMISTLYNFNDNNILVGCYNMGILLLDDLNKKDKQEIKIKYHYTDIKVTVTSILKLDDKTFCCSSHSTYIFIFSMFDNCFKLKNKVFSEERIFSLTNYYDNIVISGSVSGTLMIWSKDQNNKDLLLINKIDENKGWINKLIILSDYEFITCSDTCNISVWNFSFY